MDHGLGRSRGGFSSKIHLVCDSKGNPLGAVISGGHRHDCAIFEQVMESVSILQQRGRPRNKPQAVIADKGYDFGNVRSYLRKRQIQAIIPQRKLPESWKCHKRGTKPKMDRKNYKKRNMVERFIGWMKYCRRIATRYEKYADSFLAMIKIAFIKFYLKKYFSDTP